MLVLADSNSGTNSGREKSDDGGKHGVEVALAGKSGVMARVVRNSDSPYVWKVGDAPLDKVANVKKKMPRDFISEDGFHITDKCRRYLSPLIQGEEPPPYVNGLPRYVTLKNAPVAKKCPPFELKK